MIRLFHPIVLLTVLALTSCAGSKVASSKGATASAAATPAPGALTPATPAATSPVVGETPPNPDAGRDAYWNLAMKRYVPPVAGVQPAAIELAEPGTAVTPTPTVSTTQSVSPPMGAVPTHELNPADIPFATWAPGKRGVVKSPYDPDGRLIDVRDFSTGQLSQCPYSGKIFRVPPLK
ncbi:hypothetical protein [Prosthecobacter sp.]|uniref:hypothetical protein n=1 Tax=Prosthecobacter sp. TaxID=1965333 RepID=UPI00248A7F50|nr:hypothetical protein [Prosthecobacter sp.]MDI1314056.1 hypothetical protein [Prosthecobacter sp.]